jgi:hypothetical protein
MRKKGVPVTVDEVELVVDGVYHRWRPAKIAADPDDSRPAEGGTFEVEAVWHADDDITALVEGAEGLLERIEQAAYEEVKETEADEGAARADAWYERMKDEGENIDAW